MLHHPNEGSLRVSTWDLQAMHFPGLTWVVEDFVQEMEDGQTPKVQS